jgi:hypothetical protein
MHVCKVIVRLAKANIIVVSGNNTAQEMCNWLNSYKGTYIS